MSDTLDILRQIALQVRNASAPAENTAERVGRVLVGILERLSESDIDELKAMFLRKDQPDTANKLITFIEGLISKGLITAENGIKLPSGAALYSLYENGLLAFSMDENGFVIYEKGTANKWSVITSAGAEFQNLVIKFLAQITDLEVSNKATTLDLVVQALAKTYNLTVDNTADLMHGIIREYLTSESFVSGFLGSGFKIWKDANGDWNGEFDKLTVRKIFTIFELVVQKVVHQGGQVIRSAAGGKLVKVTDGGTYWKCEHDSTDDFLTDDQVLCQTFTGTSIKRYWRKVTSAGAGYFNLSKTDCETGSATPEAGDNVAVLGNRTNTDRQSAQIDCAVGVNAPYRDDYAGINSYSLEGKLVCRSGNCAGIVDDVFGALDETINFYGKGVRLRGSFALESSGKLVEDELNDQITAVQTAFEIREGQISSKVTQATTAATQASGYAASASGSASTASTKASEAAGSASTATTKATAASNSANAAAGSATTAGQKAADAAGSATAAQDAADDAATILSQVTTKESSINQTASNITLQVSEVTTKVTTATSKASEAATSASNAKTSETNASGSASTASSKATAAATSATNAANSATAAAGSAATAANILTEVTEKKSSIDQTADSITLKVSEVNTKTAQAVTSATNSANSATTASTAAGTATAKATEAANSASTATTKATAASGSASAAATSATNAANILTTVTSKETSINQTAQAIELKAVRAESAAGRAESAEASINLKADGIVLQASSQAAQTAVNGIQIGGRNLLALTNILYGTRLDTGVRGKFWANTMWNAEYVLSKFEASTQYTIKYLVTVNSLSSLPLYSEAIGFLLYNGTSGIPFYAPGSLVVGDTYEVQETFITPADLTNYSLLAYTRRFTDGTTVDFGDVSFTNLKIEKGNKATDWTPAPEDVTSDAQAKADAAKSAAISTASSDATTKANTAESNAKSYANSTFTTKTEFSSQLTILSNSISSKVSQTDFNSLNTRVSSAEQKITSDAIISTVSSTITTAKNEAINAAATDATTKANNAKSSAVSTAATDATTKANTAESNAKTYSNNTFTPLTTYNTKIAQLESSISLKADSTTVNGINTRLSSAEAKITSDAINFTVQSQVIDTAISYSNLAAKLAGAKMLFIDPAFKESMNSINVYNNNTNAAVTIERLPRTSDNPTDSNYQIRIIAYGFGMTPGRGGFFFGNYAQPYAEYICKFIAWVPTNCSIAFASNPIGNGGYQKWLTPTQGQGKWAEYVSYVRAGDGGNSSTNFYYLDNSTDETVTWWLCYATVFDCSKNEYTPDVYAIKSGISITTGGISIFGQTLSFAGKVTFSSLDSSTQSTINGKATTNYVDAVKSTAESALVSAGTANQSIGTLQSNLGQMAYQNMVSLAKLDSTIVEGGYFKTSLIDANAIITGSLLAAKIAATDITTTRLTVSEGCTVGGFAIGNGRIGSIASATGSGGELAIYSNFFRVGGSDGYAMLGNNVIPATAGGAFNATGRIVNQTVNQGAYWGYDACNTGLYINVSGGTKNFGIDSNAALKAPAFINTRVKYLVFGTSYLIDLSQYSVFMCYAASAKSVIMPDETSIAKQFSLSSLPSDFGCIFTFHVIGGSSDITLNNVIDWNMSSINLRLAQGDSVQLLVTKFPNFHYQVINHTD